MSLAWNILKQTLYSIKHFPRINIYQHSVCNYFLSYSTLALKPELHIMKFDTPQFRSLLTPNVKSLSEIFQKYGYQLRIAGGAVRDLLMNLQPTDIDFATTATPDEMKEMFTTENVRMFNRKGEGHGTVTVRVNDEQNFEITTLRVDLHTDGRHAEVEFTTDWELDASRRDLTINAMFLGLDGTLYDYFHGVEDLEKRKVKFVGNPESRIQEDYLRILRYFRFYGRIAVTSDEHEANILGAIRNNVGGLENIAGERLWVEFKKTLVGNHVKHIVLRMLELGVLEYLGLPSSPDSIEFVHVCERSESLKPQAVTLLSAFLKNEDDVSKLHARLKLSKYDQNLAMFIVNHRSNSIFSGSAIKPYKLFILNAKGKLSDTQEWVYELLKYKGEALLLEQLKSWTIPKFPLSGHHLIQKGFKSGPKLNIILTELRGMWLNSDCTMSQEELLDKIDYVAKKAKSV